MPRLVIPPEDGDLQYELQASATSVVTALLSLLIRGEVRQPLEHTFAHVGGDRAIETFDRNVPEGAEIVGLNVTSPESRGEVYLSVYIRDRGRKIQRIARGYVYTGGDLQLGQDDDSLDGQGRLQYNEATTTLVNNTAVTRIVTIPANSRWRVYGGRVFNADNVARNISVDALDGSDNPVYHYKNAHSVGASGDTAYPETVDDHGSLPFLPLSELFDVAITFAA